MRDVMDIVTDLRREYGCITAPCPYADLMSEAAEWLELFNLSVWQRSWMQQCQCERKLAVIYMGTSQMSSLLAGSEPFHSS